MNINEIKKDLLHVLTDGRIKLNGDALTARELNHLQQGVVLLYEKAKDKDEDKKEQDGE